MIILRSIGILISLAMAGAALLAIIYTSAIWAVIWAVGSIILGTLSLLKRKSHKQEVVHN